MLTVTVNIRDTEMEKNCSQFKPTFWYRKKFCSYQNTILIFIYSIFKNPFPLYNLLMSCAKENSNQWYKIYPFFCINSASVIWAGLTQVISIEKIVTSCTQPMRWPLAASSTFWPYLVWGSKQDPVIEPFYWACISVRFKKWLTV